jgi:hypothetical protein
MDRFIENVPDTAIEKSSRHEVQAEFGVLAADLDMKMRGLLSGSTVSMPLASPAFHDFCCQMIQLGQEFPKQDPHTLFPARSRTTKFYYQWFSFLV